ncbi:response regulator transcription factor [Halopseudomonas sabulinigri]|uniref:DNA-binding response regulator, OmpR family, contains REC and winged-helix (WHTH) domain n=2 Tax=Halopseudomonas sabulinigri TaxID=472181 RepID=A0A1H1L3C8_9GAMM|nr:DNA-binding response regulator, OmpR family, contains REC and winged-helix (wHTH) domain [Halopseudomonas sabulinigri]
MPHPVLIIDDDQELCELLGDWLAVEGFSLTAAHDGPSGLQAATGGDFAAIILDVMLPGMNGLEILRQLRQSCQTPLLMLSARGEPVDRILGLELGADDYLAKPCDPRELVARLRALLRRSQPASSDSNQLQAGNLRLDGDSLLAWRDDQPLQLTQSEALILRTLMEQAGQLVDRQTLSQIALGKSLGSYDRSLDMHISNLRRKLGPHPEGHPRIQSIRGRGYLFSP